MYTSSYGAKKEENMPQRRGIAKSKASDQVSVSHLEVSLRPVLELNAKLLNGKITVSTLLFISSPI